MTILTVVQRWQERGRKYAEMSNGEYRNLSSDRRARKASGLSPRQWRKRIRAERREVKNAA